MSDPLPITDPLAAALGFTPGFAARHDAAAAALVQAFPTPRFAAVDLRDRAIAPAPVQTAAPRQPAGPRHFSPAEPGGRPTEGWNLLDPLHEPTPFIDPLAAAHAAGYAEGLAAAAAATRADEARDNGLLDRLTAAIGNGVRFDRAIVARQLRDTVLALVTKLVGEVGVAADVLAHRIEGALALLAEATESALLRVHPDDVPLLEGRLPPTVFAAGDPALQRGSFVLETASTLVEDGPDHWLEQIAQAIDVVPVPAPVAAQC